MGEVMYRNDLQVGKVSGVEKNCHCEFFVIIPSPNSKDLLTESIRKVYSLDSSTFSSILDKCTNPLKVIRGFPIAVLYH